MDLIDKMNRVTFLGPEFITWLWYRTETQGEVFSCPQMEGPFEIWFDDRLVVGSTMVNAQENFFKGGHPPTSLEARTALRLGKLATEARLRLVSGTKEWSFLLRGPSLEMSGVKLPGVLAKEDDDRFYERFYLLEQLDGAMKGLFGQFLKLRVSDVWEQTELPAIQAWVRGSEGITIAPSVAPSPVTVEPRVRKAEAVDTSSARNPDLPPWEDPVGGTVD